MQNGFDAQYYHLSETIYRVQSADTTKEAKIGTCVDTVLVMKSILDNYSISSKIWLLHNRQKNSVHTILTFEAESKVVYLEFTPQSSKPWYGKEIAYNSENALVDEYENNGYSISDVTDLIIVGQQPAFLLENLK